MSQKEIAKKVKEVIDSDPNKDHIKSIYLFGSYLHGNAENNSDVDLLYETKKTLTLFQIGGMKYRLEQKLGRNVDFVPKNFIIAQLKDKIIPKAKKIYER